MTSDEALVGLRAEDSLQAKLAFDEALQERAESIAPSSPHPDREVAYRCKVKATELYPS